MQNSGKAYLTGALGVALSRVVSIAAGIISLWLLTQILTTENFAGYSVAMSVVVLCGYTAGLGIERSMLLRIGGLDVDAEKLAGTRLMLNISAAVAAIAVLVAGGLYFWSSTGATPRHDFVRMLAPAVPALALSLVLVTWYQANHRVGVSQSMIGLNDGVRSCVFAITMLLGLGATGVAAGVIIGAAAPLIFLSVRACGRTMPEPRTLNFADLVAGLQFLAMRLSKMGLHQFDIIALGALGSATGTAQYVVAARFAILIESGQTMFGATFAPRVRRHLTTGRNDLAEREYHVSRVTGFTAALGACLVLVFIGRPLLQEFGDFGVNFDVFMVLVATNLITVGMGLHSTFLSMTDQLGRSTANRLVCLAIFGLCLWVLVPRYDAMGAAVSFLIATIIHEIAGVAILKRHVGIQALTAVEATVVAIAVATLCAIGIGAASQIHGGLILLAILLLSLSRERALLTAILRDLGKMVSRQG